MHLLEAFWSLVIHIIGVIIAAVLGGFVTFGILLITVALSRIATVEAVKLRLPLFNFFIFLLYREEIIILQALLLIRNQDVLPLYRPSFLPIRGRAPASSELFWTLLLDFNRRRLVMFQHRQSK